MEHMAHFFRRPAEAPFRELVEQIDNKFTLLELLESSHVLAACSTHTYIFTLNVAAELKCWSMRSSKLQNNIRLEHVPKSSDLVTLHANNRAAVLIISGNSKSSIFVWDYKKKDVQVLANAIFYKNKIEKSAVNDSMLVIYASDHEMRFYNLESDLSLTLCCSNLKQFVSFLELSNYNGYLYVAYSTNLCVISEFENLKKNSVHTEDKILALQEVQMSSTSIILTGHRNHLVRLWRNNLGFIREVNLFDVPESVKQVEHKQQGRCSFKAHYIDEREELVISHKDNITVYKVISSKTVHLKIQAHRSEIRAISVYKGDPSYLVTMCDSSIRLWRYTQDSEPGMNLVGEITVSNVDKVIPVNDVGLYLVGKCYDAGLVLWRDASTYLTQQLKSSRSFSDVN